MKFSQSQNLNKYFNMNIIQTEFRDLYIIEPSIFEDDRGYFFESFNYEKFTKETSLTINFVQDNESMSNKGVLRGLHLQISPKSQAKLVRVVSGSVNDVVVDLRKEEPTFGKYFKIHLSAENNRQLFIPSGFAHGFLSLQDNTKFLYKCSDFYSKEHEFTIIWNDTDLKIDWQIENPIISEKDENGINFETFINKNCVTY